MGSKGCVCLGMAMAIAVGMSAGAMAADGRGTPDPWKDGAHAVKQRPLVIEEQGARFFGGTTLGDPAGEGSIACDHGYVDYQIPRNPRELPLLMVHASGMKTWDTTWDGRDGFRNIFLRQGYPVYLTDLPRTGRAGQGCVEYTYEPGHGRPDRDQWSVTVWRLGIWLAGMEEPEFYPGVQFDPDSLDQFLRIQYPEFNAPDNEQVETDALAVLLEEIGPSVMLTHSSTGIRGWITATKSDNVAGIVSYEPGSYVFPEGELPAPIPRADGETVVAGQELPLAEFLTLTEMPIQVVWGDYIPAELDPDNVGDLLTLDSRRINVLRSQLFAEAINRHGGDAEVLILPEIGILGNTHFPMSDLNNEEIADLLSEFLAEKGLDGRDRKHRKRDRPAR